MVCVLTQPDLVAVKLGMTEHVITTASNLRSLSLLRNILVIEWHVMRRCLGLKDSELLSQSVRLVLLKEALCVKIVCFFVRPTFGEFSDTGFFVSL